MTPQHQPIPAPDLFVATDYAVNEMIDARNKLTEQMARLDVKMRDLTESRSQKQAASLALAAEDVAKTADQIMQLAAAVHRGVAKRLQLEPRA